MIIAIISLANETLVNQEKFVIYTIVDSIKEIISSKGNEKTARDSLWRLAWALDGTSTSNFIRCIIKKFENFLPIEKYDKQLDYHIISIGKYHPIHSWWSTTFDNLADLYYSLKVEKDIIGDKECDNKCRHCLEGKLKIISNNYKNLECTRQLFNSVNYKSSLDYVKLLSKSENYYYINQSIFYEIYCHLELGNIEECIDILTTYYISHRNSVDPLPIAQIMNAIRPELRESLINNISYPIFCHIYVITINKHKTFLRSYAAEDFLKSKKVLRPSQIENFSDNINLDKLIFFLQEICIEQVMDTWIEFSSSEDVALERVNICKLLTTLNPQHTDEYQSEIRDIMRQLQIRKRISEVEKSKIFVDIESIKEVAERALYEDYIRYISLRSTGISCEQKAAIDNAHESLKSGKVDDFFALKFPRNEMWSLLEKMVLYLRDEFVGSTQHGLDGYLSVRIRHGTLEGQLRSAFEAESLLTHKKVNSEEYAPNQKWLDLLDCRNETEIQYVNKAFQDFSSQFENIVNDIKKNWLQIKKKPDDTGKINFILTTIDLDYFITQITEDTKIGMFIDIVLNYFISERLDPSLEKIREDIQTNLKPSINDLLTQLQSSIENIDLISNNSYILRSAIGHARPSVQNTLDRIEGWLKLAQKEVKSPFTIDEVISISEASIRALCPGFMINRKFENNLEDFHLLGNLPSFVDITFLIFENIVRHSGIQQSPYGTIYVTSKDQNLNIYVENEIVAEAATKEKQMKVKNIKEIIKKQPYSKSVNMEGGTGFIKIQKILNHDFHLLDTKLNAEMDFGFIRGKSFYVSIKIPFKLMEDER